VIGKKTREDHPQVMNACVRLYADAANAKTKLHRVRKKLYLLMTETKKL
jgi:vacuolar-type H+-ATPase subunit B/Vma2